MSVTFNEIEPKLEFTVLDDGIKIGVIAVGNDDDSNQYVYYPDNPESDTPQAVLDKLTELN